MKEGMKKDKMKIRKCMWQRSNMAWLLKASLKGRIQLKRAFQKSTTGFDIQTAWD